MLLCPGVRGQEAVSGISVPITISGDARALWTRPAEPNEENRNAVGFRFVASPTLKLGEHWFAYSAFEVHSSKYFMYQSGKEQDLPVQFQLMQGFVGCSRTFSRTSLLIKAGQLSSAFGIFPLEYDDAKMPLINAPAMYTGYLPLRPDQLPCGVKDIVRQTYGSGIDFGCGGSKSEQYGMSPIGLYGLPGVEAQLSISRLDARLQITNSSPANPVGLTSRGQVPQWTTGGGYTLHGGLHLGISGFRGPYLDQIVAPLLPSGSTIRDFPAWGMGVDAEWSRGPWSFEGEWQHFHFELPGFPVAPTENAAYGQAKWILSPRVFLAMRATAQHFGRVKDSGGESAGQFAGPQQIYELSAGYRLNRRQLLKIGGHRTNRNSWQLGDWFWPQSNQYALEAQLVTSFTAMSKAFR